MIKCEYCGNVMQDGDYEFCPGCGARLPVVEKKPQPPPATPAAKPAARRKGFLLALAILILLPALITMLRPKPNSPVSTAQPVGSVAAPAPEPAGPDLSSPDTAFTTTTLRLVLERAFDKPLAALSWEDVGSLRYLSISAEEVSFSLSSPFEQGFAPQTLPASAEELSKAGNYSLAELALLPGLERLDTTLRMDAAKLSAFATLRELRCPAPDGADDLTPFATLPNLERLQLEGSYLLSLNGASKLSKLQQLTLIRSNVSDLSPLAQAPALNSLTLQRNRELSDLTALASIPGLTALAIANYDGTELNVIGDIKLLESLSIVDTKVKSLDFVSKLLNLRALSLIGNREAKSLPSFERLTGIEELALDCYGYDNVSGISALTNVRRATLSNLPSIKPLLQMKQLTELTLTPGWQLESLNELGRLTSLTKLKIPKSSGFTPSNNSAFSFLTQLTNLQELDLSGCGLYFNADPIYKVKSLTALDLSGNTVCGDFSAIQNLTNLTRLNLERVRLSKNFWVQSDGFVTSISISGELPMDDYTRYLSKLTNLNALNISSTGLTKLDFVSPLTNLSHFTARDNYIADVFPLAELKGLQYLDLSANAISDWQALSGLTNTVIIKN